ncbi:MAG: hypothetical protein K0Q50_153 [Vampirovibrio sp.]|nr:hypothetical protein [Vampirovibrio sp.]
MTVFIITLVGRCDIPPIILSQGFSFFFVFHVLGAVFLKPIIPSFQKGILFFVFCTGFIRCLIFMVKITFFPLKGN